MYGCALADVVDALLMQCWSRQELCLKVELCEYDTFFSSFSLPFSKMRRVVLLYIY